jgi:hypothetical protein
MYSHGVNDGESSCRQSLFEPAPKLQKSRQNPAKSSSFHRHPLAPQLQLDLGVHSLV